jgi:nucleoside-diphosphate-sugar epimerase
MPFSVFLIGPGFIGGELLDHLLEENYAVTALVRRRCAVAEFAKLGVKAVIGTLDEGRLIRGQVAASDIVFHVATSDHLLSVQSVLDGIRTRAEQGLMTYYIHTSGTSLLADKAAGRYIDNVIYDDERPSQIDTVRLDAPHRQIDLEIVGARQALAKFAKIAIMIPPVIYGVSTREKRLSIQLPTHIRYSLKHGYAGQVGSGLSVWGYIHVKDLARGYMTLLHWMERSSTEEVLENPYFFCENGEELSWGDCAAEIGRLLTMEGRIDDPEPQTVPFENYNDLFGEFTVAVAGSNARNRANRLRKLGWQPLEKNTFISLAEDEIPLILEETGEFHGYGSDLPHHCIEKEVG